MSRSKRTYAHIINPAKVDNSSDLYAAQPITFETTRIAREFAATDIDLELLTAQYPEDRSIIPDWFHITADLDRSVLDLADFQIPRKLPLLTDILGRLSGASQAEYFIYSNADISLMPHFYVTVDRIIDSGVDALVINRRTISNRHSTVEEIPLMYSELGEPHRGYDCFIFKRDLFPHLKLGLMCIGVSKVGNVLVTNLFCYGRRFNAFRNEHLTFHIGNLRNWTGTEFMDYHEHNVVEALRIMAELESELGPFDRSGQPGRFLSRLEGRKRRSPF